MLDVEDDEKCKRFLTLEIESRGGEYRQDAGVSCDQRRKALFALSMR